MKLSLVFTTLALSLGALALPQGGGVAPPACGIWNAVMEDLQTNFFEGGQCTSPVRKVLRIVFHDSICFSQSLTNQGLFGGGGADGSIIAHSDVELTFPFNNLFEPTVEGLRAIAIRHGVSFGDIIQFATAVGMSNCPGSPRLEFLAGRSNSSLPSPPSLVPRSADTVDAMLERMADAGFSPEELVDLMAAHSLASQEGLNPVVFRSPLDSTPQTFDTQFYIETSLNGTVVPDHTPSATEVRSAIPGQFRMRSDARLARDPRTACHWQALAADHNLMSTRFRAAMAKMSVVGFDRNTLTDCSAIIPEAAGITTTPTIPPGMDALDLENSCPSAPFPALAIAQGAPLPSLLPAP